MDEKKELKTTEAQRKASVKWQKANYKRIPLDVRPERHDELKKLAESQGMTLGAWIKLAIDEKIKRDTESRHPEQNLQKIQIKKQLTLEELEAIRKAREDEEKQRKLTAELNDIKGSKKFNCL